MGDHALADQRLLASAGRHDTPGDLVAGGVSVTLTFTLEALKSTILSSGIPVRRAAS